MTLEWKRVEPTTVEQVGYRTMVRKHFTLPDGSMHEFVTKGKEGSHSQAIIAITMDGHVVLAKQFRPGPEKIMYELPGGGIESGETSEQAVVRELREETGYEVGMVKHLGDLYKGAYTNTLRSYFIAYDCIPSELGQDLDDTEFIEPVLVTVEELFDLARKQAMTDTEALFLAYDELQLVREGP